MSDKYRNPASKGALVPWVIAILFFAVVCLCASATIKRMTAALIVAAVVAGIAWFKRLRDRVHLPLIALGLIVLMDFVSTFYAVSGKFTLNEFIKVAAAFSIVLILLALPGGEGETPGRRIAAVLSRASALMGLLSIDLLSTRWLSSAVLGLLGSEYSDLAGVEAGVRMISIFRNPNTFAGVAGLGVLLTLGLVMSSKNGKERTGHLIVLSINALSFVLAFSMGAIGVIAAAFVVYLLLEFKQRRAALFVLMVETLAVTVIGMAVVSMTSLEKWSGVQPIPLLCVVFGAVVLWLLDSLVGQPLAAKLANHGKSLLIVVVCLVAALAVGAVAAYNMTGSAELAAKESLRRSVYPDPGEYTVSAQVSGPVTVKIESQNREETMMHTSTVLYKGDLSGASFTVPEDSKVVYFTFSSKQGAHLEQVTFSGPEGEGEVPLGYTVLPGFVANRLQGLFANQNAIQRTVFFEDGLKLFRRSPIVGLGMGSFENGILSVQSFFYETKYAHNHYIQVMAETGIIGLLLFVGLLLSSAVCILRSRRKETAHPLVPMLGAALVFMAGHAAVEVVFSFYAYLPMAFGVFGLINLCCGDAIALPKLGKKGRGGILAGMAALLLAFLVLLWGNMLSARLVKEAPSFDSLDKAIVLDRYEWADYMLSYVVTSQKVTENAAIQYKAARYALELEQVDSNAIPIYLAEYYLLRGEIDHAMDMIEKYVTYVASRQSSWQTAFTLLEHYEQDTLEYKSGVLTISRLLDEWNAANMGKIELDEQTMEFLARIEAE